MNQPSFLSSFRNKLSLITGIAGIFITCSCSEEDPEPLFTASVIRGHVSFYYGDPAPEDIIVTARGPYKRRSVLTDSQGEYWLSGLGNGTYELEFMKEGYGTKYQYGIQLFGNDTVTRHELLYEKVAESYKLPLFYEIHDRITYPWVSEGEIVITTSWPTGNIPPDNIMIRVFMSDRDNVSYMNYQSTRRGRGLWRNGFDNLLVVVDNLPFEYGQEIYLIAYVCNPDEEGYLNNYLGIWTFSTLEPEKHSQVMSFTMH